MMIAIKSTMLMVTEIPKVARETELRIASEANIIKKKTVIATKLAPIGKDGGTVPVGVSPADPIEGGLLTIGGLLMDLPPS